MVKPWGRLRHEISRISSAQFHPAGGHRPRRLLCAGLSAIAPARDAIGLSVAASGPEAGRLDGSDECLGHRLFAYNESVAGNETGHRVSESRAAKSAG